MRKVARFNFSAVVRQIIMPPSARPKSGLGAPCPPVSSIMVSVSSGALALLDPDRMFPPPVQGWAILREINTTSLVLRIRSLAHARGSVQPVPTRDHPGLRRASAYCKRKMLLTMGSALTYILVKASAFALTRARRSASHSRRRESPC